MRRQSKTSPQLFSNRAIYVFWGPCLVTKFYFDQKLGSRHPSTELITCVTLSELSSLVRQ